MYFIFVLYPRSQDRFLTQFHTSQYLPGISMPPSGLPPSAQLTAAAPSSVQMQSFAPVPMHTVTLSAGADPEQAIAVAMQQQQQYTAVASAADPPPVMAGAELGLGGGAAPSLGIPVSGVVRQADAAADGTGAGTAAVGAVSGGVVDGLPSTASGQQLPVASTVDTVRLSEGEASAQQQQQRLEEKSLI